MLLNHPWDIYLFLHRFMLKVNSVVWLDAVQYYNGIATSEMTSLVLNCFLTAATTTHQNNCMATQQPMDDGRRLRNGVGQGQRRMYVRYNLACVT